MQTKQLVSVSDMIYMFGFINSDKSHFRWTIWIGWTQGCGEKSIY